jgi:hypothetical protein
MGKRTSENFIKLPRKIFSKEYGDLSVYAKWLYVFLHELDTRYTGTKKVDYFFRSDQELAQDLNISLSSVKRAKRELIERGLIKTGRVHWWADESHTKKSKKKVTSYHLL